MVANEITICNMALANLGQRRFLTSTDGTVANVIEDGPAATACTTFYGNARDSVLRAYEWAFAETYALLVLNDDGAAQVWEDEWDNAYDYPADCLVLRRFITGLGPTDPQPPAFKIGTHTSGVQVIFTDVEEADANVVYTRQVTDVSVYPEDFVTALAWRLAADLAMTITSSAEARQAALREYMVALSVAERTGGNEMAAHEETDGEFLRDRSD